MKHIIVSTLPTAGFIALGAVVVATPVVRPAAVVAPRRAAVVRRRVY